MRDFAIALIFFTRLPLTIPGEVKGGDVARASRYYPVVGALVGLFVAACYMLAARFFPPLLAATLAAVGSVLFTGAFHEDALGDVADAFGGGATRERKLDIMKDSRQGTYGVLALALALLVRIQAIALIPPAFAIPVLVAAHAVSRVGMVWMLWRIPVARTEGLGAELQHLSWPEALIASGLGLLIALLTLGPTMGAATLLAALVGAGLVTWVSLRNIQGISGDVLGSSQQVGELFALLVAIALATGPLGLAWRAPWWP